MFNCAFILLFMVVISIVCGEGLNGGECVKSLDNRVFAAQLLCNIVFSIYYLLHMIENKWHVVILNLIVTAIFYSIAAMLHSISKAGFW